MKYLFLSAFSMLTLLAGPAIIASTISGTIYDNRHNGLSNVNVELLDQYHSLSKHTMTDGIGRYSFENVSDGEWYVRVLPFKFDLEEETRSVSILTISQNANRPGFVNEIVDFVLTPKKGTLAAAQAQVVVAQVVPDEAKKIYEDAVKIIKKGQNDQALLRLQEAVKAFPDYFLANNALGSLYFDRKDYEHAVPPLMVAAKVYEKSPMTLFYLGYSLSKLNYRKAAIIALNQAAVLAPASPAIFLALGTAQRLEGDYRGAEASLLQSKKLTKTPNGELFRELAALYGEMRQYDKGAENLEEMLKAGAYSEADKARIRDQIKVWRDLATKQPTKSGN